MKLSLSPCNLTDYLTKQLACFYPDKNEVHNALSLIMPRCMERLTTCFSSIHKKYYYESDEAFFNHLHADHYAMFLYIVANEAYLQHIQPLAEKAFLLNKALHGIDAFYAISLPEIFLFVHPIGTVLGNAHYKNYFVVYQNVTVGSDLQGVYPSFGYASVLYSKSSVIGECLFGDNVCVGAHSFVRNKQIPDNSIVVGNYPHDIVKFNKRNNRQDFFS